MTLYLEIEHNQAEDKHVSVNELRLCMKDNTVINVTWDSTKYTYEDGKTILKITGVHINSRMDDLIKNLIAVRLNYECQDRAETFISVSDIYLTVVESGKAQGFRFFKDGRLMYKTCLEI